MNNKRVILISGMSGAGKSSAMSVLEDMGYHCIDQFPVQLLSLLTDLIQNSTDIRFNYTVLATSAHDFMDFIRVFKGCDLDVRVLYLDASNDVLLHRYKSTRRTHPLLLSNISNTLEEAISTEREIFTNYKDPAFLTIDTSFLDFKELKNKIEKYFAKSLVPVFTISFISFGYKHGVPLDADMVIDVRFLPNPFYDPLLRDKTGNQKEVYDYVMDKPETQEFIVKLKDYCDFVFSQYEKQNKSHMIVAIGCTGGQHRSVSICNWLYDEYKDTYRCFKSHRDIGVDEE